MIATGPGPRVWQSAAEWVRSHPVPVDSAIVSLIFALAAIDVATGGLAPHDRPPNLLTYVLLAGQILPFLLRRQQPYVVMYVVVFSLGLYWILEYPGGSDLSGVFAIYCAVVYGEKRQVTFLHAAAGIVILTGVGTVLAAGFFIGDNSPSALVVVAFGTAHLGGALFGEVVHQRRQWLVDLKEKAARVEASAGTRARLAVVEERTRIAREMHDVVTHGMGIITVQAAAAQEIAHTNPTKAVEALANIELAGREAIIEMRRMLDVLRNNHDSPASRSPQPGLADIPGAVSQSNGTGVATELVITGRPQTLAPGIELAAFRIAQEALTNVLKHAGSSASAKVTVAYQPEALVIEVADDGRGAASSLSETGGGNGLIGMRERTEIYGGEFVAGPTNGGGYAVRATIPVDNDAIRPRVASAERRPDRSAS